MRQNTGAPPFDPQQAVWALVSELVALPRELDWFEFKVDVFRPELAGEYISALANAAALAGRPKAFMVWGVENDTHEVVGTSVDPFGEKVGNEDVVNWLTRLLKPQVHFEFRVGDSPEGHRLLVLEVEAARSRPVAFRGTEWIRVGSYKKKLLDHGDHERRLWLALEAHSFEGDAAAENLSDEAVLQLLDFPSYFELLSRPLPDGRQAIMNVLLADGLVVRVDDGSFSVTNLGAILFARELTAFPRLSRKVARVVHYKGNSRVETINEQTGTRGYANGFSGLVGYLNGLIPANEVIGQALRKTTPLYPEPAIRELVANALIHQDFTMTGTGPMIELFSDRLEITNPGKPLIDPNRFIDSPPQSRNETLAAMMRRIGVCEERGSGWDKVLFEIEFNQLPPPLVEVTDGHTRTTMFAPRPLTRMDKTDRIRAIYQHACIRYVNQTPVTNTTVRERFGIDDRNSAIASRLLRDALDARLIIPYDAGAGPRAMRYLPFWARPDEE